MNMEQHDKFVYMIECGALFIHTHSFKEGSYVKHIRLFPRQIHGVEVLNVSKSDFENSMANLYAENYGFLKTAGSDNHRGSLRMHFACLEFETPFVDINDFIEREKAKQMQIFEMHTEENT